MNYERIQNTEARQLLTSVFHFSYHVYNLDNLIDQLEEITEKLPIKDEFGNFNPEVDEIQNVVISLRVASRSIHEVMGATYGEHVKNYMDECQH